MALINQLNAATDYHWYQTSPEDILNKASALVWKLMGNAIAKDNWAVKPSETVSGGLMVKVPLKYALSHHGAYGPDTVIEQSKKNLLDAARFRWAGAYGSNTLNLTDFTANSGPEQIIDLLATYVEDIKVAVRVDIASQVIAAAADDDSIEGLGDLFQSTDTTIEYGAIAESTMATWKANVITTAEAISFEVMQKIFRTVGFGPFKDVRPNFCVTTDLLADAYERSLVPQQRFKEASMVEAGWDHVLHKGAPIVADAYYTASYTGYLDALNLNYLSLRSHANYNFTAPEWVAKKEGGQPDIHTANTRWRGNLYCNNRQMHVRHTNLTEPA